MRRRWLIAILLLASVGALIWLGLYIALPLIVRHEILTDLGKVGLGDATFDVKKTSLWHTSISKLAAGGDGSEHQLDIGSIAIDYSPLRIASGTINSVIVHDAHLNVPLNSLGLVGSNSSARKFGIQRLDLDSCVLSFDRNERTVDVPFNATVNRIQAGILHVDFDGTIGAGTIAMTGTIGLASGSLDMNLAAKSIELQRILPLIATNSNDINGAADVQASWRSGGGQNSAAAQITAKQFAAAGQTLSDVVLKLDTSDMKMVKVSDARFAWAGGAIWAEPFTYDPTVHSAEFILRATTIDLQKLLDIITKGRATGSGQIDAKIPMKISGWPNVVVGDGWIATDGPGTLELKNADEILGGALDEASAGAAEGMSASQIKQQVLNALSNFQFTRIEADLKRTSDSKGTDEMAAIHIVGHGRTGAQQQLDIQLNIHGVERALNTYLATRALIFGIGQK